MKFGVYCLPNDDSRYRCVDGIWTRCQMSSKRREYPTRDARWQAILNEPGQTVNVDHLIPKLQNSGQLSTYCRSIAKVFYGVPDDVELYQPGDFGIELDTALRKYREKNEMTQKELAEKSGVNIRQIQKLESREIGIDNITLKNAIALAEALGVNVVDLTTAR